MKKLVMALMFASLAIGAAEFRIESEGISDQGEWKQSVGEGLVGRKMLVSMKGVPAGKENILTGTYACPETGKYYVWVRTESRGENYRKTQIKVNGKPMGKFGDAGVKGQQPKMEWKRSLGPVEITEGEFKVEFIPLSAVSRLDSIIFTTDQNFKPSDDPREVEEIDALDCE